MQVQNSSTKFICVFFLLVMMLSMDILAQPHDQTTDEVTTSMQVERDPQLTISHGTVETAFTNREGTERDDAPSSRPPILPSVSNYKGLNKKLSFVDSEVTPENYSTGFPYSGTVFRCNYKKESLGCVDISGNRGHIDKAIGRKIKLYESKASCEAACGNLILSKESGQSQAEAEMIKNNIPSVFRFVRDDELSKLSKNGGSMTWTQDRDLSVFSWVKNGSKLKKRGQYASFAGTSMALEKYHSLQVKNLMKKNPTEKSVPRVKKSFVELNMGKLVQWGAENGKEVRLPKREDLDISWDQDGFPHISVKIDPKAVIVLPIAYPEWQDFFFPAKYENYTQVGKKGTSKERLMHQLKNGHKKNYSTRRFEASKHLYAQNKSSLIGRGMAITDKEVLLITDSLPLEVFDPADMADEEFKAEFRDGLRSVKKRRVIAPKAERGEKAQIAKFKGETAPKKTCDEEKMQVESRSISEVSDQVTDTVQFISVVQHSVKKSHREVENSRRKDKKRKVPSGNEERHSSSDQVRSTGPISIPTPMSNRVYYRSPSKKIIGPDGKLQYDI